MPIGSIEFGSDVPGELQMLRLIVADRNVGGAAVSQHYNVSDDGPTHKVVYRQPEEQDTRADPI